MHRIHKHALAQTDLIDIWVSTFHKWGEAQAEKYHQRLDTGIRQLANHPRLGKACDDVREGYRVLFIARHAIYYTLAPGVVHIIRVLHEQMDPYGHLPQDDDFDDS